MMITLLKSTHALDNADPDIASALRKTPLNNVQAVMKGVNESVLRNACKLMVSDDPTLAEKALDIGLLENNRKLIRWAAGKILSEKTASNELRNKAKSNLPSGNSRQKSAHPLHYVS